MIGARPFSALQKLYEGLYRVVRFTYTGRNREGLLEFLGDAYGGETVGPSGLDPIVWVLFHPADTRLDASSPLRPGEDVLKVERARGTFYHVMQGRPQRRLRR